MAARSTELDHRPRPGPSPVGRLLQHWRRVRRMSQLDLAVEAQVTPRHVSFVESGRARPSREMVLALAGALDVPLRERNQLLLAAGYAPLHRETGVEEPAMAQIRGALDQVLRHHEPFPAVVLDRHWDILMANAAATAMFAWLLGRARSERPANVLRLMFDPDGLRPFVANWDQVAEALVQRVHREAIGGVPDPDTAALLQELLALPRRPGPLARARPHRRAPAGDPGAVPQGPPRRQLLLHGHHRRHATGRHRRGAPAGELLPSRPGHRSAALD